MKDRILTIRKEAGLSQEKFAKELELSRNFIALVESGERGLSNRTITDICKKFNVNETWLRDGSGEMHSPPSDEQKIADVVRQLHIGDEPLKQSLIYGISRADEGALRSIFDFILEEMKNNGLNIPE